MPPGPRDYTPTTVRKLDLYSGGRCMALNCDKSIIAKDGNTIVAKISHIEAASPEGPRYNPSMTDDERRHYDNLLLLCDECHGIIDNKENEAQYPTSLLKKWKHDQETRRMFELSQRHSLLIDAITIISEFDFENPIVVDNGTTIVPSIDAKIEFNSIKRNRILLEEYKIYYSKLNSLYEELELQGSFKKRNLLRYINGLYLKAKGELLGDSEINQDTIRLRSDDLIEFVRDTLSNKASEQSKVIYSEEMEFALDVILVDAFIRCKVLEKPI